MAFLIRTIDFTAAGRELIRDWVARCMARPSAMRTAASDAALKAG